MNQTEIFAATESDAWFRRNRRALVEFSADRDPLVRVVRTFDLRPKRILEIGGSNGARVAALARELDAQGVVIEPSAEAVADGAARYPHIRVERGVCHALPTKERFDLVLLNYVFSWVERSLLMPSIAEVDRVVEDGGYLLVGDFYPARPSRVPYHHVPGDKVYTYKQDYAAPFVASGLYESIGMVAIEHDTGRFHAAVPEAERSAAWLLRKTVEGAYVAASRPGG